MSPPCSTTKSRGSPGGDATRTGRLRPDATCWRASGGDGGGRLRLKSPATGNAAPVPRAKLASATPVLLVFLRKNVPLDGRNRPKVSAPSSFQSPAVGRSPGSP